MNDLRRREPRQPGLAFHRPERRHPAHAAAGPQAAGASARSQAQWTVMQGVFGAGLQPGGVVQRLLRTRDKPKDEAQPYEPPVGEGFLPRYTRLMADDTSVLVEGRSGGVAGVVKVLKETPLDGGLARQELARSVMDSAAWSLVENQDVRRGLAERLLPALGYEPGDFDLDLTADVDTVVGEGRSEGNTVYKWVMDLASGLAGAGTVGGFNASALPVQWHSDLAQIVYDQTSTAYQGQQVQANPFVPPFRRLIGQINDGIVTGLRYVRKYGQNTQPGAEFVVDAPDELRDTHANQAVVHTHYPAVDKPPNYAHTKPYAQRFDLGYGYTVLNLGQVKTLGDAGKTFDAL